MTEQFYLAWCLQTDRQMGEEGDPEYPLTSLQEGGNKDVMCRRKMLPGQKFC